MRRGIAGAGVIAGVAYVDDDRCETSCTGHDITPATKCDGIPHQLSRANSV